MSQNTFYWWDVEDEKVCESVFAFLNHIQKEQSYRQVENFRNMKLYGNYDLFNLRSYHGAQNESASALSNRVTMNIVQSMVDTVVSKITKNKPKPKFLTTEGDFTLQNRAKKLNMFVEGQFQCTDFYSKSVSAFLDSCIFGTGALKVYRSGDKIKVDRVFIDEIIVSDRESFYGEPRQLHQKKYIHKDVLKAMFPKYEFEIERLGQTSDTLGDNFRGREADMILVTESWHLRSSEDSKDGKHAISIKNKTLLVEDYDKDYFPFIFWKWTPRPLGFFGQGLSEQLTGLQLEINKILKTIQVSMHLVSIPKIFIEQGSKIVDSHIDNKIGGIVKFHGQPPIPGQLGSIPSELFSHLDRLYSRAYEIAGISQLSATSRKPSGLDSGKALREYNDIESERFMACAQRYEATFLEAAKHMIALAKEIDEEYGKYSVNVKSKSFLKSIKWKDVNLQDDQYQMDLFPTSSLSNTPAGRLQDVQDLIAAGFIGREDALDLLDFPDLENYYKLTNSPIEDIKRLIEKFVDDGEYETPEPYQNLDAGIVRMQQAYLYYRAKNASDDTLELFRRWIEDAKTLLDKARMEVEKNQIMAQQAALAEQQSATADQQQTMDQTAPIQEAPLEAQIPGGDVNNI